MDSQHVATEIELRQNVTEIWRQLGRRRNYWQTLCNSMDNRLQLVTEVNVDWTKY